MRSSGAGRRMTIGHEFLQMRMNKNSDERSRTSTQKVRQSETLRDPSLTETTFQKHENQGTTLKQTLEPLHL